MNGSKSECERSKKTCQILRHFSFPGLFWRAKGMRERERKGAGREECTKKKRKERSCRLTSLSLSFLLLSLFSLAPALSFDSHSSITSATFNLIFHSGNSTFHSFISSSKVCLASLFSAQWTSLIFWPICSNVRFV